MEISILLCNPKMTLHKPGAGLIRWVENTDFSHCAVMFDGKVYHAVWPHSKADFLNKFMNDYDIKHAYKFNVEIDQQTLKNYLEMLTGRVYSVAQLFLILLGRISRVISKITFGWILNHEHHLICSELAGMVMEDLLNVRFQKTNDNIDLIDIYEECENLNSIKK